MWRLSPDVQSHCVEAIISLLRETDNTEEKRIVDAMSDEKKSILVENLDNTTNMVLSLDIDVGRKLLSRYGIYLILGLIEPTSYGPPVRKIYSSTRSNYYVRLIFRKSLDEFSVCYSYGSIRQFVYQAMRLEVY